MNHVWLDPLDMLKHFKDVDKENKLTSSRKKDEKL